MVSTHERKDRTRSGGGVLIYISNKYRYSRRNDLECHDLEMICIQIHLNFQRDILVICVYRPPTSGMIFFDKLDQALEVIQTSSNLGRNEIFLLGDLNCDFVSPVQTSMVKKLKFITNSFNLVQLINTPTRVTDQSSTTIDVIFSSNPENVIEHGCIHCSLSDHFMVYVIRKLSKKTTEGKKLTTRSFKNFKEDEFNELLKQVNWKDVVTNERNIDDNWKTWKNNFLSVLNTLAPIKQIRVRDKSYPWITSDIRRLMTRRDMCLKKAIKSKCNVIWSDYRRLRNEVNSVLRRSKCSFFRNEISRCSNDPKSMWKCLKMLLPKQNMACLDFIQCNGIDVKGNFDIANTFNNYFVDLNKTDNNTCIMNSAELDSTTECNSRDLFDFTLIDDDVILRELSRLDESKSVGLDGIAAKPLKIAKESVVTSIKDLVNQSLNEGTFITEWKSAKVIPLHKKGDVNDVKNYRPISVLSAASKIVERIVHKQFYDYLLKHSILSKAQFGFRPGHSTGAALASLTHPWHCAIDIGHIVCAIYVDLRRAFDTVQIYILLCKLRSVGCSEKVLRWFKSYLCERSQNVSFNDVLSDMRNTFAGVPQGSILGPLLFLIMINDLPNVLKNCKLTMYADDTTLYLCGKDQVELQNKMQEDLDRVGVWLKCNKLNLNIDKTNFMIIGTKQRIMVHDTGDDPISIKFDGKELTRVRSTKCLGVMIDENLTWHEHIDYVCRKVIASLSMLRRVRSFLGERDLTLLYNCLIQSQLDYCCEVWGLRFDTHIHKLEVLQKRAARMILNASFYTPSIDLFKRLNILPFHKRVMYFRCIFIYKCINDLSADFFKDTFLNVSSTHAINTRYSTNGNLVLPKCNTECFKRSFIYAAINSWNSLPNDFKGIQSVSSFKGELKSIFYHNLLIYIIGISYVLFKKETI